MNRNDKIKSIFEGVYMKNDQPAGLPELETLKFDEAAKILIVKANYNGPQDELLQAFKAAKSLCDKLNIKCESELVPGSLEIDTAIRLHGRNYHGYVALGAILPSQKSEGVPTSEQAANLPEVLRRLGELNKEGFLIGTGIISHLIDRTSEQWGENAMDACLRLVALKQRISRPRTPASKRLTPAV